MTRTGGTPPRTASSPAQTPYTRHPQQTTSSILLLRKVFHCPEPANLRKQPPPSTPAAAAAGPAPAQGAPIRAARLPSAHGRHRLASWLELITGVHVRRSIRARLDCDTNGGVVVSTATERRFFFDRSRVSHKFESLLALRSGLP